MFHTLFLALASAQSVIINKLSTYFSRVSIAVNVNICEICIALSGWQSLLHFQALVLCVSQIIDDHHLTVSDVVIVISVSNEHLLRLCKLFHLVSVLNTHSELVLELL